MNAVPRIRIVGGGRAGGSFARALSEVGWSVEAPWGRDRDPAGAATGVDLLLIAVPDAVVSEVAALVDPVADTVVAHCSGTLGLDVLDHPRVAAIHPLVALPDAEIGARRLRAGAWFGLGGDLLGRRLVEDLEGHWFEVADSDRATYHAAAVVASNHLVALMGQVERLSRGIGVPAEAYWALARGALDDVVELGAARALTGPVARGDWATVARHLAAMDDSELDAYRVLAAAARRLVDGTGLPPGL